MKTKLYIFLFLISLSQFAFGQEWIYCEFNFEFADIKNEKELSNINFQFIDGPRTDVSQIVFNKQKKQFNISFLTMGGGSPILVLERNNKKMYILLEVDTRNLILSEFKEGFFKPNGSNLVDWEDIDKYMEWIKNSELLELKLSIIENK